MSVQALSDPVMALGFQGAMCFCFIGPFGLPALCALALTQRCVENSRGRKQGSRGKLGSITRRPRRSWPRLASFIFYCQSPIANRHRSTEKPPYFGGNSFTINGSGAVLYVSRLLKRLNILSDKSLTLLIASVPSNLMFI